MNNEAINTYFPSEHYKRNEHKDNDDNIIFTGVKAYSDALLFCLDDSNYEIKVNNIHEATHKRHPLKPGKNKFTFLIDENGDSIYFSFSELLFDMLTFQSMMKHILNINPDIIVCDAIAKIIEKNYSYSQKAHFDFKVHKKDSTDEIFLNSEKVQGVSSLIVIISMVMLIVSFPIIGEIVLKNMHGENFGEYRIGFLFASAFLISMILINILLALQSKYKGHAVSVILLLLSVIAIIVAFI